MCIHVYTAVVYILGPKNMFTDVLAVINNRKMKRTSFAFSQKGDSDEYLITRYPTNQWVVKSQIIETIIY